MERTSRPALAQAPHGARRVPFASPALIPALALVLVLPLLILSCGETTRPVANGMFRAGPDHQAVYPAAPADGRGVIEWSFQTVDRLQLQDFMESSNHDEARSVVVFAMDHLPETVAAVPSDTVLARRYLEAGGKIVWLGLPPLAIARDEEGVPTSFSRNPAQVFLGVSYDRYDMDQYGAYPTPEGKRWGFTDWWVSSSGVEVSEVTTALALDDNGGAPAWVKSFGGPSGSGFVALWGTYRPVPAKYLEQIRRVAEYGIGVVVLGPNSIQDRGCST